MANQVLQTRDVSVVQPKAGAHDEFPMPLRDWRHLRAEMDRVRPDRQWPLFVVSACVGVIVTVIPAFVVEIQRRQSLHDPGWDWLPAAYVALVIGAAVVGGLCLVFNAQQKTDSRADLSHCKSIAVEIEAMFQWSDGRTELVIQQARYGAGDNVIVVTDYVKRHLTGGRLEMLVANATFDNQDPAENVPKTITILYTWNGESDARTFAEGEMARIP
jgi:hypothetical protein